MRFHDLRRLCGGWTICLAAPAGPFGAALRLSQPWHIQDLIDLHRAALSIVCFMLDTISWDVVYAAPPHHDGTWSFLADYADGLLFDSAFSQQRFVRRFARARRTFRNLSLSIRSCGLRADEPHGVQFRRVCARRRQRAGS